MYWFVLKQTKNWDKIESCKQTLHFGAWHFQANSNTWFKDETFFFPDVCKICNGILAKSYKLATVILGSWHPKITSPTGKRWCKPRNNNFKIRSTGSAAGEQHRRNYTLFFQYFCKRAYWISKYISCFRPVLVFNQSSINGLLLG